MRPATLHVSKNGENFPKLLKTVRLNMDPGVTKNAITKLRQIKSEDLLIELDDRGESAELVQKEVSRSLEPDVKIRKLVITAPIEIQDSDGETTKEEVIEVLTGLEITDSRCVSIRKVFG